MIFKAHLAFVALILMLYVLWPLRSIASVCSDVNFFARDVIDRLRLYEAARDAGGPGASRKDWQTVEAGIWLMGAIGSGRGRELQSCDDATYAAFYYVVTWFDIDAMGNGSHPRSLTRLRNARDELLAARRYETKGYRFGGPTIS